MAPLPPASYTINPSNILASVQAANGIIFDSLDEGAATLQIGTASGAGTATFATNRPIAVDGETATINLNGYLATFSGTIISLGTNGSGLGNETGASDITVNDTSSGAKGVFILPGASNNANFYGNWVISAGTLNVSSDASLGNTTGPSYEIGQINLNGGTLQAGASFTSVRSLFLGGGSTIDTNGFNPGFSGSLTDVQRTLTVANTSTSSAGSLTLGSFNAGATATLALAGGSKGETVTLTNGFVRSGNATVIIAPAAAADTLGNHDKVFATTAPTLTNGIVSPWIIVDSSGSGTSHNFYDFATYNSTTGFTAFTGYSTNLLTATATSVVKPVDEAGTITLTGDETVYALNVTRKTTITGAHTSDHRRWHQSGRPDHGRATGSNASAISVSTLAFNGSEGIIYTEDGGTATISRIAGSNGPHLLRRRQRQHPAALTSVEAVSGPINIDSGEVSLTGRQCLRQRHRRRHPGRLPRVSRPLPASISPPAMTFQQPEQHRQQQRRHLQRRRRDADDRRFCNNLELDPVEHDHPGHRQCRGRAGPRCGTGLLDLSGMKSGT